MASTSKPISSGNSNHRLDYLDLATPSPSTSRVREVALRILPEAHQISDGVRELELNVPVSRVDAIDFNVPVPDLESAEDETVLRIVKQPSSPDVELQIKRLPKNKVVLYNAYGRGKGLYFDLKKSQQEKLRDIYHQIKQYCLEKGEIPEDAKGFTINWSKHVIRFFDPSINQVRLIDLERIIQENPEIEEKAFDAELMISTKIYKGDIRIGAFIPNNKGSYDGAKPLIRTNPALQSLPQSTGEAAYQMALTLAGQLIKDDPEKDAAIKRMGRVETLLKTTEDAIVAKRKILLEQSQREENPATKAALQKKVNQLDASLRQLKQVDTFALYSALACYPLDSTAIREVGKRAEFLLRSTETLTNRLGERAGKEQALRPWVPDLPVIRNFRGEPPVQTSRFYPIDVAGLMFSGLPSPESRVGYVEFCKAHDVFVKSEGIEDALFRYALGSEGEIPKLNALIQSITDEEIKREIVDAMNGVSETKETQERLTLSGTDLKSRITSFRQQAGLTS